MKALRFILPILLILAVIGLLAYEGLVAKNLESGNMVRGGLIIAGAIATMFKKPRQRPVANKKALYQIRLTTPRNWYSYYNYLWRKIRSTIEFQ